MCDTPEVKQILDQHPLLVYDQTMKKIVCLSTGMEILPRIDVLTTYINGKSYKHIYKKSQTSIPDEYRDLIVPDAVNRRKAQCQLTLATLNNTPHDILLHTQGKRFLKAYLKWKECQSSGEVFKPKKRRRTRLKVTPGASKADQHKLHKERQKLSEMMQDEEFSDLYPAKYLQDLTLSDDDDDDEDYEDVEENEDEDMKIIDKSNDIKSNILPEEPKIVSEISRKRKGGAKITKAVKKKTRKKDSN